MTDEYTPQIADHEDEANYEKYQKARELSQEIKERIEDGEPF